jgi:hypothetical protein
MKIDGKLFPIEFQWSFTSFAREAVRSKRDIEERSLDHVTVDIL